ncbi:MAG: SDR family NAD(P)-dependent oxidoreductase [Myxococcales bacterium]|nr:SDR family NAD(P)-dependent oxidoreductase [Myxococcales bacterium]
MNDTVCLITGCSSGFGLLATVELARAGFRVIPTMRNLTKRTALDEAVAKAGVRVEPLLALDVTDEASIRAAAERVEKDHGRLDVLVNNAGFSVGGPMERVTADQLRAQLETNVIGLVEVTKAFLPMMRARRSGRIINISSAIGRLPLPMMAPYTMSKWALEGLSEAWSYELRPFGIDMVLIEPGAFKTEFNKKRVVATASAPDDPYRPLSELFERKRTQVEDRRAAPDAVARLIAHVATMRNPKLRYPIGRDALLGIRARAALPFPLFQRVMRRMAALPERL